MQQQQQEIPAAVPQQQQQQQQHQIPAPALIQQQQQQQQIPTTPLERAKLLERASDAAAAAAYAAGAGPFQFTADAGQTHTVIDMLPSNLMELTGGLVQGAAPFQPWSALGFWNDQTTKLLRPQPTSRQRFPLADGQQATVSLAYNAPGPSSYAVKPLGGNLGLISASMTCRVSTKSDTQAQARKLAEVCITRHLVLRPRQAGTADVDMHPFWRQWTKQQNKTKQTKPDWEVGCVALYYFTGNLKEAVPEEAKLRVSTAAAAPGNVAAVATAAALGQGPATVPGGEAAGAAAAPWQAPGGLLPAAPGPPAWTPAVGAGGLQQPAAAHHGPAVDAAGAVVLNMQQAHLTGASSAAAAATVGANTFPGAVPLVNDADLDALRAAFAADDASAALSCSLPSSLLDELGSDGAEDAAAGGTDAAGSAGGVDAAAAAAAADPDETDSEDGDTDSLPDLGPDPVALQLLAVDAARAQLQRRLLELAAGMHGQDSMAVLANLLPRIEAFNLKEAAGVPLVVQNVRESWFLERSVLHLLVSTVQVWGPRGDLTPLGLSDACRTQLLDRLCGESKSLEALLELRNLNKATPWFTAAHFANAAAVQWLISRPELTFRRMLRPTKRGECQYCCPYTWPLWLSSNAAPSGKPCAVPKRQPGHICSLLNIHPHSIIEHCLCCRRWLLLCC